MDWMKTYHDDHKAVLIILAKLEGSIMDMKHGMETPHTILEFNEFGDILVNVIIPHFQQEEKTVYPEVSAIDEESKHFISKMYEEHRILYNSFENYQSALVSGDKDMLIGAGTSIIDLLRQHINKEEDDIPVHLKKKIKN